MKTLPPVPALPGEDEYLRGLLAGPMTDPDSDVIAGIDVSPFDPGQALDRADADRLCDPAPMTFESGWTVLPDRSVQIAVRTLMPDVTPEMIEWWFDWHPGRDDRYRVWHPVDHFGNGVLAAEGPGLKPSWGVANLADEDIGDGRVRIRIEFTSPVDFGFAQDYLDDPAVGTIICARAGDGRAAHTDMAHVFLRDGDGLVLRSRFWIGNRIRPRLPGPLSFLSSRAEQLFSRKRVRTFAIPDSIGPGLSRHCAEEYANLNRILPGLFERFSR